MPSGAELAEPDISAMPTVTAIERLGASLDLEAWTWLVHAHGPSVRRLMQRMLADVSLVEDACQQAFLAIRDGAHRFHAAAEAPEPVSRRSPAVAARRRQRRSQMRAYPAAPPATGSAPSTRSVPCRCRRPTMSRRIPERLQADHRGMSDARRASPLHPAPAFRRRARLCRTGAVAVDHHQRRARPGSPRAVDPSAAALRDRHLDEPGDGRSSDATADGRASARAGCRDRTPDTPAPRPSSPLPPGILPRGQQHCRRSSSAPSALAVLVLLGHGAKNAPAPPPTG